MSDLDPTQHASEVNELDALNIPLCYPAVLSLRVSCALDAETALGQEGHQVGKVDLSKGFNENAEAGPWQFHIGASTHMMEEGGEGVEDVIFVRKEKGGEFDVPEGFVVDPTNLLSASHDETEMVIKCFV